MRASLRPELSRTCVKYDSPPRLQRRDGRAVPGFERLREPPVCEALEDLEGREQVAQLVFLYSDAGWTHWETPKWA